MHNCYIVVETEVSVDSGDNQSPLTVHEEYCSRNASTTSIAAIQWERASLWRRLSDELRRLSGELKSAVEDDVQGVKIRARRISIGEKAKGLLRRATSGQLHVEPISEPDTFSHDVDSATATYEAPIFRQVVYGSEDDAVAVALCQERSEYFDEYTTARELRRIYGQDSMVMEMSEEDVSPMYVGRRLSDDRATYLSTIEEEVVSSHSDTRITAVEIENDDDDDDEDDDVEVQSDESSDNEPHFGSASAYTTSTRPFGSGISFSDAPSTSRESADLTQVYLHTRSNRTWKAPGKSSMERAFRSAALYFTPYNKPRVPCIKRRKGRVDLIIEEDERAEHFHQPMKCC